MNEKAMRSRKNMWDYFLVFTTLFYIVSSDGIAVKIEKNEFSCPSTAHHHYSDHVQFCSFFVKKPNTPEKNPIGITINPSTHYSYLTLQVLNFLDNPIFLQHQFLLWPKLLHQPLQSDFSEESLLQTFSNTVIAQDISNPTLIARCIMDHLLLFIDTEAVGYEFQFEQSIPEFFNIEESASLCYLPLIFVDFSKSHRISKVNVQESYDELIQVIAQRRSKTISLILSLWTRLCHYPREKSMPSSLSRCPDPQMLMLYQYITANEQVNPLTLVEIASLFTLLPSLSQDKKEMWKDYLKFRGVTGSEKSLYPLAFSSRRNLSLLSLFRPQDASFLDALDEPILYYDIETEIRANRYNPKEAMEEDFSAQMTEKALYDEEEGREAAFRDVNLHYSLPLPEENGVSEFLQKTSLPSEISEFSAYEELTLVLQKDLEQIKGPVSRNYVRKLHSKILSASVCQEKGKETPPPSDELSFSLPPDEETEIQRVSPPADVSIHFLPTITVRASNTQLIPHHKSDQVFAYLREAVVEMESLLFDIPMHCTEFDRSLIVDMNMLLGLNVVGIVKIKPGALVNNNDFIWKLRHDFDATVDHTAFSSSVLHFNELCMAILTAINTNCSGESVIATVMIINKLHYLVDQLFDYSLRKIMVDFDPLPETIALSKDSDFFVRNHPREAIEGFEKVHKEAEAKQWMSTKLKSDSNACAAVRPRDLAIIAIFKNMIVLDPSLQQYVQSMEHMKKKLTDLSQKPFFRVGNPLIEAVRKRKRRLRRKRQSSAPLEMTRRAYMQDLSFTLEKYVQDRLLLGAWNSLLKEQSVLHQRELEPYPMTSPLHELLRQTKEEVLKIMPIATKYGVNRVITIFSFLREHSTLCSSMIYKAIPDSPFFVDNLLLTTHLQDQDIFWKLLAMNTDLLSPVLLSSHHGSHYLRNLLDSIPLEQVTDEMRDHADKMCYLYERRENKEVSRLVYDMVTEGLKDHSQSIEDRIINASEDYLLKVLIWRTSIEAVIRRP